MLKGSRGSKTPSVLKGAALRVSLTLDLSSSIGLETAEVSAANQLGFHSLLIGVEDNPAFFYKTKNNVK